MSSADTGHVLRKRQLLAACGSCVGVGALGGYAYGSGFLRGSDCAPTPLDTAPTDWPLPDYDGGHTRSVPSGHAPERGLTERWSVDVQDPGHPIAINGTVFVTSHAPSAGVIRAYDLSTGDERWATAVSTHCHRCSLVAGGDSLFLERVLADEETVSRALATADGSERWTSDVSGRVTPVLDAGLLVVWDSSTLIAIDARTGAECWRATVSDFLRSCTVHAGGTIVLDTSTGDDIVALDARTGERRWTVDISEYFHPDEDTVSDAVRGHIVAGTDRVFFRTYGGRTIALDAATGETDWVTPESLPELPTEDGRPVLPPGLEPAAVSDDALVAIESDGTDRSDSLQAIDPTTGTQRWAFEPDAAETVRIRPPAVSGETVFVPASNALHLVDLESGDIRETHALGGYTRSVALADSACLVTTTEGITAFEAES